MTRKSTLRKGSSDSKKQKTKKITEAVREKILQADSSKKGTTSKRKTNSKSGHEE